jgi:hypothetical protein
VPGYRGSNWPSVPLNQARLCDFKENAKMKWKNCWALKPGDTRVVRKFLFIPRHFGQTPTRWLEYAWIVEKVVLCLVGGSMDWHQEPRWVEQGWRQEPVDVAVNP